MQDIQLLKIVSNGQTNCYVSALNRSNAMDPSQISGPDTSVSIMLQSFTIIICNLLVPASCNSYVCVCRGVCVQLCIYVCVFMCVYLCVGRCVWVGVGVYVRVVLICQLSRCQHPTLLIDSPMEETY